MMTTPPSDNSSLTPDKTSLFIVSLPRSLSSQIYQASFRLLELRAPGWITDGEILNVDRMAAFTGERNGGGVKFTHPLRNPLLFVQLSEFLDHVAQPTGYAYKDVIQPFVVARWSRLQEFNVLRIRRPLTDIAYSMLHQGWHYPTFASLNLLAASQANGHSAFKRFLPGRNRPNLEVLVADVVEGLVRAQRCLDGIPAATVEFDDVVTDPNALVEALASLYPDIQIPPTTLGALGDTSRRRQVLGRRDTAAYREIEDIVRECEATIPIA